MNNKNKILDIVEIVLIFIGVIASGFLGWIVSHHLYFLGVTFVTLRDIMACYGISLIVVGFLVFFSIIALDNKFR